MSSQIHDLGYRSYQGERAGVGWAIRSLAMHSVRRALGLKRSARHKIVPTVTIVLAFLPAVVMAGLAAFLGDFAVSDLLTYGQYINTISFALVLFAAASAPGVLTTDRTSGMLALYLASPLNRTTYVVAKAIGIFGVMLTVTVAPIVFLVLAYTFVGAGPGGLLAFAEVLGRALLAGTIAAGFFTGLGMFVSSIPKRWSVASVGVVAVLLIPAVVSAALTEGAGGTDWLALISPARTISETWERLLDDPIDSNVAIDALASWAVVFAAIGYTVVFAALTWWRYQHLEVDR